MAHQCALLYAALTLPVAWGGAILLLSTGRPQAGSWRKIAQNVLLFACVSAPLAFGFTAYGLYFRAWQLQAAAMPLVPIAVGAVAYSLY
jgi:hypothetical protein